MQLPNALIIHIHSRARIQHAQRKRDHEESVLRVCLLPSLTNEGRFFGIASERRVGDAGARAIACGDDGKGPVEESVRLRCGKPNSAELDGH